MLLPDNKWCLHGQHLGLQQSFPHLHYFWFSWVLVSYFALNSFISFVKNKISSRGKILQKSDDSYFRLNKVITRVYCQGRSELSFKIRATVMIEFDKNSVKVNLKCLSAFYRSRGMKFENVSVLVESILEVIKEVRYCWYGKRFFITSSLIPEEF